jgi:hypothetical protein
MTLEKFSPQKLNKTLKILAQVTSIWAEKNYNDIGF